MRKRFSPFAALLMTVMFVITCSGCSKSDSPPAPSAVDTAIAEDGPTDSVIPKINGKMPASIGVAYKNAEDIFLSMTSTDWQFDASLTALKSSLAKVRMDLAPVLSSGDARARNIAGEEDVIDSNFASLADAIRTHDRGASKRESNRLTKSIAGLASMYSDAVPGALMTLKYYSRQFDIAASTGDTTVLQDAADGVRQKWSVLRSTVEAHGGVTEAQRFNDLVDQLEAGGLPGQLGSDLQAQIDVIQEVLKRPLKNSRP